MFKLRLLQLAILLLLNGFPIFAKDGQSKIVTSFTILEDLVLELGGDRVSVTNLVPRNSDAHIYSPKPSDAVAISNADLIIFNGLGFEGWIFRLIKDSDKEKNYLISSDGINSLNRFNEIDPHAWQSFKNIRIYIDNISGELINLMPEHEKYFALRRNNYLKKLFELEMNLSNQLSNIPIKKRIVITSHDAFGYLGREFNIEFLAPLGLSLDAEASAEDVAKIINQIKEKKVTALFMENINNPKLLKAISKESGVPVGGKLYSDALSEIGGPAGTYIDMMRHNVKSLIEAFNS
jgi:zinc/manganese transport system substrate-binding protein